MKGADRRRVLELLRRHGWNSTSFQILEEGFSYWSELEDALVAYVDTGSAWVAAGAPIAAAERLDEVTARFVARAKERGRRVCFFAAEARLAALPNLETLCIGEQPVWDPEEWAATLRRKPRLREQLRRARAKGVTVRLLDPAEVTDRVSATHRSLRTLMTRWLASRSMAPMGFLVALEPFEFPDERRYFLAERAGEPVAFLVSVPVYGRKGWLIEDLVRDPTAPNGTAETLIDAAIRGAHAEGSRFLTLGLAPLAGPVSGWLRLSRGATAALYDFDGLRAFKARLGPEVWDPIYLAYPTGTSGTLALYDTLVAFARGSFVRFGLETLLRGPAVIVRVLAVLLIPWTVMLALADTRAWFPSATVQYSWVAFDLGLVVLLFSLASRWREILGVLLAVLVTADAVLTLSEAWVYNAPRIHGGGEAVVVSLACLGPLLAMLVLWGAVRTRWHARRAPVSH